jgi:hypothetical protein
MSLPGFTAEAALYASGSHYYVDRGSSIAGTQGVVPAAGPLCESQFFALLQLLEVGVSKGDYTQKQVNTAMCPYAIDCCIYYSGIPGGMFGSPSTCDWYTSHCLLAPLGPPDGGGGSGTPVPFPPQGVRGPAKA